MKAGAQSPPSDDGRGDERERVGGLVPPDEADNVRRLVAREVANVIALHKAETELEHRKVRY